MWREYDFDDDDENFDIEMDDDEESNTNPVNQQDSSLDDSDDEIEIEADDRPNTQSSDDDFEIDDSSNEIANNNSRRYQLRERNQINFNLSNNNSDMQESIIELNDDELTLINFTQSSSSESITSSNTFPATEIVGEPRQLADDVIHESLNSQPSSQFTSNSINTQSTITQPQNNTLINQSSNNTLTNQSQNNTLINQQQLNSENINRSDNQSNNCLDNQQASSSNKIEDEKQEPTSILDDSDIETCLICCEPYHSTNEHRMVNLKCGHIFGKECIERWLKCKDSKKRCPKCNQTSNLKDIRLIYAKSVRCIDTTELDETKQQLEKEKRLRLSFEQKIEELKFEIGIKLSENMLLKQQLAERDNILKKFKSSNQIATNLNQIKLNSLKKDAFTLLRRLDLKVDGCRSIVVSEILGYIIISQPTSPNSLVKGFGIRRIPINNLDAADFLFLHQTNIKDMALHPVDAILLTASFDKTVKLVNLMTRQQIGTFNLEAKPWCVTWNREVNYLFYIGLNNGLILECSQTQNVILKKINAHTNVPIKLIRFLSHDKSTNRVNLLITSMNGSYFGEIESSANQNLSNFQEPIEETIKVVKPLPITGSIISTNVYGDNNSGHILITVRPSNKYPNNVQHYLFDYKFNTSNQIRYNLLNTFLAGSSSNYMTNSQLFPHPNKLDSLLVFSGDENLHGAFCWEKNCDKPLQTFNCGSVVFDIAFYKTSESNDQTLALLTEKSLSLYKWTG